MDEYAIRVRNVEKKYKLFASKKDRIFDALSLTRKKRYKEHFALKGLSFDVKKGESVGLVGINGAGKSTILKIITGVLSQTSGEVEVNGRISALLELGAGFNPEYTGLENVYLNGFMIGFTRQEIDEKLDEILEFADIGEFINQPVKTYSSGMFVRLAFAVAINVDPEILIVDEALSVGDVFFQAKCYKKFEEFSKAGKTILFVSHDLGTIDRYCDRAILLNHGTKVMEGKTYEVIDCYKKLLVKNSNDDSSSGDKGQMTAVDSDSWKSKMVMPETQEEYGDKLAVIEDFGVFNFDGELSSTIRMHEQYEIRMKIKFNEEISNPVFAVTLRDIRGTDICGTNTIIEKKIIEKANKGETITVSFKQNAVMQAGNYLVQLGCVEQDAAGEIVAHHRIVNAFNMQVLSSKTTIGYFDIDSQIEYTRG